MCCKGVKQGVLFAGFLQPDVDVFSSRSKFYTAVGCIIEAAELTGSVADQHKFLNCRITVDAEIFRPSEVEFKKSVGEDPVACPSRRESGG